MDLSELTILQAHQGLKNKKFSSQELVKDCLSEIKKNNKKINAFITILEREAIEQAENADKKIVSFLSTQGDFPYLMGIPLAIKDNILIEGVLATAGSKILSNYKATYDATVIKKLRAAGAIFLGKTNLDEFAMGSSTESSYFGPTKNPCDLKRVPGGSSGGSAAAVKSKMCLGALGSDTGGSIRLPASFCGVYGLKTTYGRVSRFGLIAMASSLDQIGPFGKCADDLAVILKTIEGRDSLDSTSADLLFSTELPQKKSLKNYTFGVPKECFGQGLDKEVKKIIEKTIADLEKKGAKIKEVSLPYLDYALACYYIIMPAEVSANLARYDSVKYGYSAEANNLLETYLKTRTEGFGDEVRRRIILGTYTLSAGYYDAYYLQAQKVRTLIKKDFARVFKTIDALITPTSPTTAFKIGEKMDDPLTMYLSDVYTVPVNLAGLPALSMPVGDIDGLPVGLQLIAKHFEENKILDIAKTIE